MFHLQTASSELLEQLAVKELKETSLSGVSDLEGAVHQESLLKLDPMDIRAFRVVLGG